MAPVEVVAILSPAEGKSDRIKELLKDMAVHVQKSEPDTLRYHMIQENPSKKNPNPSIVIVEKYTNGDAIKSHGGSSEFKAFGRKLAEEKLVSKPMQLFVGTAFAGFEDREVKGKL